MSIYFQVHHISQLVLDENSTGMIYFTFVIKNEQRLSITELKDCGSTSWNPIKISINPSNFEEKVIQISLYQISKDHSQKLQALLPIPLKIFPINQRVSSKFLMLSCQPNGNCPKLFLKVHLSITGQEPFNAPKGKLHGHLNSLSKDFAIPFNQTKDHSCDSSSDLISFEDEKLTKFQNKHA